MENRTSNNQKSKTNEGLSLGEITCNPKPWVVVEFAGMENETIGADFATFKEAAKNIDAWYGADEIEEINVRIMRRLDNGQLTTEF